MMVPFKRMCVVQTIRKTNFKKFSDVTTITNACKQDFDIK